MASGRRWLVFGLVCLAIIGGLLVLADEARAQEEDCEEENCCGDLITENGFCINPNMPMEDVGHIVVCGPPEPSLWQGIFSRILCLVGFLLLIVSCGAIKRLVIDWFRSRNQPPEER